MRKNRHEGELAQESEHSEGRRYRDELAENSYWKRLVMIVAVLAFFVAGGLYFLWESRIPYVSIETIWSKQLGVSFDVQTIPYASGVIQYNKDGMMYYNQTGSLEWTKTYEMRNPQPFIAGGYVVMADIGYTNMVICNIDGYQGTATSPLPITTVTLSEAGVTAVVVEEEAGNHILFFDKTGSKLGNDIRTLLDQSGYPLSLSLSPDGQMMFVSYVYISQGTMNNKLVFYNFQDADSSSERMVGAFQQYGDTLFGEVTFLTNKRAVAFGDGKIVFYSLKNRIYAEELKVVTFDTTIKKVFYDKDYIAVVTETLEPNCWNLAFYDNSGNLKGTYATDYLPTNAVMTDDCIYYHDDYTMTVLGKSNRIYVKKFQGNFGMFLDNVVNVKGENNFVIYSNTSIVKVKLKK